MNAQNNAARVAVKAAACPSTAAEAKPKDIFDHLALGLPHGQWVEPSQEMATARHQVAVRGLLQIEALVATVLNLMPTGPENCASRTLLRRVAQLNTAVAAAVWDDGENVEDLQKVVDECQ